MKQIYHILLISIAVIATACKSGSGEYRDASLLGKTIWSEAKIDIEFTAEALINALNFNTVINETDPILRSKLITRYFGDVELITTGGSGSYSIKSKNGSYVSYNTGNKSLGKGVWRVKRHSGSGYDIVLTPTDNGGIRAEFSSLHIAESTGSADIVFTFQYVEREDYIGSYLEAYINYEGSIITIDKIESSTKPITLTITTSSPCNYYGNNKFGESHYDISCHDALYNCTDKISVDVYSIPNRRDVVTCYGEIDTYLM